VCRSYAELGGAESGEVFFLPKPIEDRVGGAHKMGMMGEQVAALADIDGSQLSSPFVDVAKQVAVNGLQSRKGCGGALISAK
jgi:hypothetical protein